jgi:hypothetical protein
MSDSETTEEYEGVTINVDPTGWPDNLAGIIIAGEAFYIENDNLKIIGDPIWKFGEE